MIPRRAVVVLLLAVAAAAGQTASRPAWGGAPADGSSTRFSRDELDFARSVAAGRRGLDHGAFSDAATRLEPDPPTAGFRELTSRFDPSRSRDLLPSAEAGAWEERHAEDQPPPDCIRTLGAEATIRFAGLGRDSAIEELIHHEWTRDSVMNLCQWGGPLRRLRDPRVVRIHVDALLAARRGFQRGDCDSTWPPDPVATITNFLRERSTADQEAALGWLDGAPPFLDDARWSQWLLVRAALGDPPTPKLLTTLEPTGLIDTCEISLEPWSSRYVEILPSFRADPRRYWFQLVLLRDQSVVGELGKWLDQVAGDLKQLHVTREVTVALRVIGGKAALEALYRAAPGALRARDPRCAGTILYAIVRLESPDQWKRVAALADPASSHSEFVRLAAVELLAKKP